MRITLGDIAQVSELMNDVELATAIHDTIFVIHHNADNSMLCLSIL